MILYCLIDNLLTHAANIDLNKVCSNFVWEDSPTGTSKIAAMKFIPPGIDDSFSKIAGRNYRCDEETSGVFKKPIMSVPHFDEFKSPDDWCMVYALDDFIFNLNVHNSGAKTCLEKHDLNYRYLPDWNYYTSIQVQKNQAICYRPWLFHSFDGGTCLHFNMIEE